MFEQQLLLEQLGDAHTNEVVAAFRRFVFIPFAVTDALSRLAMGERWGRNNYVLEKYLAVHVRWSIEQDVYTASDSQWFTTAGHLQTSYGVPLYLEFISNPLIDGSVETRAGRRRA